MPDLSAFLKLYADTSFRTGRRGDQGSTIRIISIWLPICGLLAGGARGRGEVLRRSFLPNVYRLKPNPAEWAILKDYDKPVVIGEFHFGSTDRGAVRHRTDRRE